MKKILFLVAFLAVAAAVQSNAGKVKSSFVFGSVECSYDQFVKYCNEAYDVKIVKPEGFEGVWQSLSDVTNNDDEPGIGHLTELNVLFASLAGDCFVALNDLKTECDFSLNKDRDLHAVALNYYNVVANERGFRDYDDIDTAAIAKHVETLCAKDFNADAAVLVRDVPFDKVSGLGWKYKTCTRVYVKKKGRPMLTLTIVFKDMPEVQRRAYVAKVVKSIGYGAAHWKYDLGVVGKLQSKYGF